MIRLLLAVLVLAGNPALAEQKQDFGDFVAHYSAQNTSDLDPEVARKSGISRSPHLAMVMVTVQKKTGEAVTARVTGLARNLLGQVQPLDMREIREGASIYYLGLLTVSNMETQTFNFDIKPSAASQPFKLRFSQQFFID